MTLLEEEKEHKIMSLGPDGEVRPSTERLTLSLLVRVRVRLRLRLSVS